MAEQDELAPGTVVDKRFRVERRLGSGGMGIVYKVEDILDRESCALKLLRAAGDEEMMARQFRQEAKTLLKLDHRNIIKYKSFGLSKDGNDFLVVELMNGGSLDTLLKKTKPAPKLLGRLHSGLTRALALELMYQCCSALAYLHENNIAHRDLKPANLLLSEPADRLLETGQGTLKLADFGIASRDSSARSRWETEAHSFKGTWLYAAPEHLEFVFKARGRKDPGKRTFQNEKEGDIFALGLIMYELWKGEPFMTTQDRDETRMDDRDQWALKSLKRALERFKQELSSDIRLEPELKLLKSLLSEDPTQRPSAEEAKTRLKELCDGAPPKSAQHESDLSRATYIEQESDSAHPVSRSRSLLTHGLTLLVGGVLGWGSYSLMPALSGPREPAGLSGAIEAAAAPVAQEAGTPAAQASAVTAESAPASAAKDVPASPAEVTAKDASARSTTTTDVAPAQAATAPKAKDASTASSSPTSPGLARLTEQVQRGEPANARASAPPPVDDDALEKSFTALVDPLKPSLKLKNPTFKPYGGGSYLLEYVRPGSGIDAPADGTLQVVEGKRPDGSAAYCVVIHHEGNFRSKLCGLLKGSLRVTKGTVTAGQRLGQAAPDGLISQVLYQSDNASEDAAVKNSTVLDLKSLWPKGK